jgi:hypothetical protein
LANAIAFTLDADGEAAGLGRGAGGVPTADQDVPPLSVVKMAVHGAWAHDEVPSTKPRDEEVKLTETGLKPEGAGVPVAPATDATTRGKLNPSAATTFLVVLMPYLTPVRV